jgi:hypothetical protein
VALLATGVLIGGGQRTLAYGASASPDLQRYGEALLAPINTQYSSSPVNGGESPLWNAAGISSGALAVVPGPSDSLSYILTATWLAPNTAYSLYIEHGTCSNGPLPGTFPGPNQQTTAFNLGVSRSNARGEIVAGGTLQASIVATSDWAVHVQPNNPNGPAGYCGDVNPAMGVVTLAPLHGGKIAGVAVMSQRPEPSPTSDSAPTTITEIVVYAHGFAQQTAHLAAVEAGSCSMVESQVEYPLNDVVSGPGGAGVSGTITQTQVELVNVNQRLTPLHITVYNSALQPAACGTLPHTL